MSEWQTLHTRQSVLDELDISPATLRRWGEQFSEFLSPVTNPEQNQSHRRYTDEDLGTLRLIKKLMNDGLTYEQVRQHLAEQTSNGGPETEEMVAPQESAVRAARPDEPDFPAPNAALVAADGGQESPALTFLTNTLAALSDTQQSILNSQAANRELLGVLIQDNFNLKEENTRLRERIMEVERTLAQMRQEDEWRREALRQELDAKIGAVQRLAADALVAAQSVEAPDIKAIKSKPGCLGALLGLSGDTQIVTVPKRKKAGASRPGSAVSPTAAMSPPSPTSPTPMYPKPTRPPE